MPSFFPDLGMLNLPHNSYRRIASFDESRIRKMIIQCTKIGPGPPDFSLGQIRHHSQICYMRSVWDSKTDANTSSSKKPVIPSPKTPVTESPRPYSAGTPSFLTNIPTPSEFTSATSAAPKDKHKATTSSHTINDVTPSHKKSRINSYDADDEVTPKNSNLPAQPEESKCWADSIIGGILMFTDETDPPEDAVTFAQISPFKPTPVTTLHTSYADYHWTDGRLHIHPPPDVLIAIDSYLRNHQASLAVVLIQYFLSHSPWITHSSPRYCSLTGNTIVDQLYGCKLLDHEACCLIFRRLNQIDNQSLYPGSTPKWRRYIEADFSTTILAGDNVWDMLSVQKQFIPQDISDQLPNTRLFIIPAYLQSGWSVYCWDMKRKIIHMCDPLADACSYTAQKASHVIIADKLHNALFTCLNKFFKSWHVDSHNWKKNFQFLSATLFDRNESSVCMIHMARYFNGIGLATKLDNETLVHQKKLMVAKLLQLHGNLATLPATLKTIFHG